MKYKGKTILQKVEYAWKPTPSKSCATFDHGDNACPLKGPAPKPRQIQVPKKVQTDPLMSHASVEGAAVNVEVAAVNEDTAHGAWTLISGKSSSGKLSPPKEKHSRPASPPINASRPTDGQGNANRFLSLSNLEGDSNVSKDDLVHTTALIMNKGESPVPLSGIFAPQTLSSTHQLDSRLPPKATPSSSSAIHIPAPSGVIIKEKGNTKRSS